ncbi:MAG: hypothetical protein SPJ29_08550 [Phocaeicola sp.]|nr:hypothetical protein [Prevotellaceae bacterium]MDY5939764.1 hypothetical protein [Phocaeicola sp.]
MEVYINHSGGLHKLRHEIENGSNTKKKRNSQWQKNFATGYFTV